MPKSHAYRYIFGPVPSRRLGRSLGVDLSPHKTCTLDCVFCQLGGGQTSGAQRYETVPTQDVLDELAHWLETDGQTDWITLSGSGEPTLHSRFGDVIAFARQKSVLPVALLSNGTLFSQDDVRQSAVQAQLVKISLSAWDPCSFQAINRPHPDIGFDAVIEGYRRFRALYSGIIWMEVFLIPGMNDSPSDVAKIAELARSIGPNKIQLNTAVRPPAETFVRPLDLVRLQELATAFDPPAEVIAAFHGTAQTARAISGDSILSLLKRHPARAEDIAAMLECPVADVRPTLLTLIADGRAWIDKNDPAPHYRATMTNP